MKYLVLFLLISVAYSQGPVLHQPFFLFAHQKNNADSINAIGNYGEAAQDTFIVAPPVNQKWVVNRMIVDIEDAAGNLAASDYGGISGGLDSGVVIQVNRGTSLKTVITNGLPIKSNVGWSKFCYDLTYQDFGTGNDYIQIRWSFFKTGQAILLDGGQADTLMVILNDTLTGLISHNFQFQGYNKGTRP
jgi:hypothetical protein